MKEERRRRSARAGSTQDSERAARAGLGMREPFSGALDVQPVPRASYWYPVLPVKKLHRFWFLHITAFQNSWAIEPAEILPRYGKFSGNAYLRKIASVHAVSLIRCCGVWKAKLENFSIKSKAQSTASAYSIALINEARRRRRCRGAQAPALGSNSSNVLARGRLSRPDRRASAFSGPRAREAIYSVRSCVLP